VIDLLVNLSRLKGANYDDRCSAILIMSAVHIRNFEII